MQIIIGLIALAGGIWMLILGHSAANSINSQVQQLFTGAPTDRSTYFYIAGTVLVIFAVIQFLWREKR